MRGEQNGGIVHYHLLGLLIHGHAFVYILLDARFFQEGIQPRVGITAMILRRPAMEENIGEIFRVGIISAPSAAEDLTIIAGKDLIIIIIIFNIFDL